VCRFSFENMEMGMWLCGHVPVLWLMQLDMRLSSLKKIKKTRHQIYFLAKIQAFPKEILWFGAIPYICHNETDPPA
jgi:hypothetical protein